MKRLPYFVIAALSLAACSDHSECTTTNAVPTNGVCACPRGTRIDASKDECVHEELSPGPTGASGEQDAGSTPQPPDGRLDGGELPPSSDGGGAEDANSLDAAVTIAPPPQPTPKVVQVVAGGTHTCARLTDGIVKCWGGNGVGQLGDGTLIDRRVPTVVAGLSDVVELAAGYDHTCARLLDHTVRCWGDNTFGGLGDGTMTARSVPVQVLDLRDAEQVAAGGGYTCVRNAASDVRCWGVNTQGQLGDDTRTPSSTPKLASISTAILPVNGISAGAAHACAQLSNGEIRCWGRNDRGQLGEALVAITPAQLSTGAAHSCVVSIAGEVFCWGDNMRGKLGTAVGGSSATPVRVAGIANAEQVAAGGGMTCARLQNGTVSCWGDAELGSLGDGSPTGYDPSRMSGRPTPASVAGVTDAKQITAGDYHACALLSSGSLSCWGRNDHGQLGNDGPTNQSTPVAVEGIAQ